MKKNVLRILAAVLALTMVFSLAACGDSGKEGSGSSSSSESSTSSESSASDAGSTDESSTDESSSEASAASTADGSFATVKAFLEDPATKAQLDKSISDMVGEDETMSVSLDGTDDTLIYSFQFSDEAMAATDEEALKTALESGLNESAFVTTFESIASSIATVVDVDNVKVKVVYAKADGTELASKEYTAG